MLGLDLAAWNTLMWLSLGLAAFAAIAIFLTTRVVITLQDKEASERADEFARYKIDVGERAARLEAEAANARLETERLKQQMAPRVLSAEQLTSLIRELPNVGTTVSIRVASATPEVENLGNQIIRAFDSGHVKIDSTGVDFTVPRANTDIVVVGNVVAIAAVKRAFESTGLTVTTHVQMEPGTVIVVMPKPHPK